MDSMREEVKIPELGESFSEGTVVRWLKRVGDAVERDEPLLEISTDKVDHEIGSPASGVLVQITVQEGEAVQVDTVVGIISKPPVSGAHLIPNARADVNGVSEPPSTPEREGTVEAAVMSHEYDAFISYRRERSAAEARAIRAELGRKKVNAFLDVDDLRSGRFNEALLRRIEQTPNFIVILSENCLERCSSEQDWLRREIAHATTTDRNIIPVLVPGFHFPDVMTLPQEIRALPLYQSVEYTHSYFLSMIEKIIQYLRSS
jgi:hypothetical protein